MEGVWFREVLTTFLIKILFVAVLSCCVTAACDIPGPVSFPGRYKSLFLVQNTKELQVVALPWEPTTMNGRAVPTRNRLTQSREPQSM